MGVGGQYHAPAALPPRKTRYPLCRRLSGPQGRSGRVRKISPSPGFDSRTVQPVASRDIRVNLPKIPDFIQNCGGSVCCKEKALGLVPLITIGSKNMRPPLRKSAHRTLWVYMCMYSNMEKNMFGKCNSCSDVHLSLLFRKTDTKFEIQFQQ